MEAIVVDTEKTARDCIRHLKEQRFEPETFLPLDFIRARPLKERLRNITCPKNVKLLYDVLSFWPKQIERAILFATSNALVCETPEDAAKVAYDLDPGIQYDVRKTKDIFILHSWNFSEYFCVHYSVRRWTERSTQNRD